MQSIFRQLLIIAAFFLATVSMPGCREKESTPTPTPTPTPATSTTVQFSESARRKLVGLLELPSPDPAYALDTKVTEEQAFLESVYEDLEEQVDTQRIIDQFLPTGVEVSASAAERQAVLRVMREQQNYDEELLLFLPDEPSVHDEVFAWYEKTGRPEAVGRWLMRNTGHLRNQLLAKVAQVDERDGYVTGELDLRALARLDWKAAERELKTLRDKKQESLNALGLALEFEATGSDVAKAALVQIAENRSADPLARNYAVEGLLIKEWPGREETYFRLFRDPTLRELHTGNSLYSPLQDIVRLNPDHWIPKIALMVGNEDPAVHDNAVAVLVQFHLEEARADALEPLLPWLKDPDWSRARDRLRLIQSLEEVALPGAGAGLLAAVKNSEGFERSYAAESLSAYPEYVDPEVIVNALETARDDERTQFMKPLLASGYYSAGDQVEAIISISKVADELMWLPGLSFGESDVSDQAVLGGLILRGQAYTDEICSTLLRKRSTLQEQEEKVALERVLVRMRNPLIDDALVESLSGEEGTVPMIAGALRRRDELSQSRVRQLREIAAGTGFPKGLATVALRSDPRPILSGGDVEAQAALLAGARLLGDPLPVSEVEMLLNTKAAAAAEAYLVAQDTPEAIAVLRGYGYSKILGHSGGELERLTPEWERELQDLLKENLELTDVYALFTTGYYEAYGQFVVLLGDSKAEFRWYGGGQSYRTRTLSTKERGAFLTNLTALKADELSKLNELGGHNAEYQFLHLTRESGRRVYFFAPEIMGEAGEPYVALADLFKGLLTEDTEKRSRLVEAVEGAKIAVSGTDERMIEQVRGDDQGAIYVRVGSPLLGPSFFRSESGQHMSLTEQPQWFSVDGEQLVPVPHVSWVDLKLPSHLDTRPGLCETSRGVARVSPEGLLLHSSEGQKRLLAEGIFAHPVASKDGEWLLCSRAVGNGWLAPHETVLVEVASGKIVNTDLSPDEDLRAIAYLPSRNGFLVAHPRSTTGSQAFLLQIDGRSDPLEGDIGPLVDALKRPLQARSAGGYWATLPSKEGGTDLGVFDPMKLRFQLWMKLPGAAVSSDEIWVQEERKIVNIVLDGDLIQVPLGDKPPGWI